MAVRGIRGATSIESNTRVEIISKTKELLQMMVEKNEVHLEDIASVIFSVTDDIDAEFPAIAARDIGWIYTPLFCTREIPVKGSVKRCIRVLIHINSDKNQEEMIHIYLRDAKKLRPDLETDQRVKYYISNES